MFLLEEQVVRKVLFCKYLFESARRDIIADDKIKVAAGVHFLQDAVEVFLVALGDHVGAAINTKTSFERYFSLIEEKTGRELPNRTQLIRLNCLGSA